MTPQQEHYLKSIGVGDAPLADLLRGCSENHQKVQSAEIPQDSPPVEPKKYDLEERATLPTLSPPMTGASAHANPIKERFGDYEVKTWDIHEDHEGTHYFLSGKLSLSKIKKEKYKILFITKEREIVEWQSIIDTTLPSLKCEFYHPRRIAEVIVGDLKKQGIEVNYQKTEELLINALTPYVNMAKWYCIDLKQCRNLSYGGDNKYQLE